MILKKRSKTETIAFFAFTIGFLIFTLTYFSYHQANANECHCQSNDAFKPAKYHFKTLQPCESVCKTLNATEYNVSEEYTWTS